MLCFNGLGHEKLAKEHEARYLRFKADESSQAITGPYRQHHPEDNNERQAVHEHVSVPLPQTGNEHVGTDAFVRPTGQNPAPHPRPQELLADARSQEAIHHESRRHGEIRHFSLRDFLCASVSLWLILALVTTSAHAQIHFRDITAQAGIRFTHNNGAFGKKWLPETMGPGCAFIDYDNDGLPDILLINGTDFPGTARRRDHAQALSQQWRRHVHRRDAQAGLACRCIGFGVAVGDYDNDGFDDIFVTALGQSHLFHNDGNGTFTDVAKRQACRGRTNFRPAPPGSTTTATASLICL